MDERTELIQAISGSLPSALIGLDFDGTLAPLELDPQRSQLAAGAAAAIHALAAAGAHVVVITGRDAMTALRLSGLADVPGLSVDGLYGAERWQSGQLSTRDDPPELASARATLAEILAHTPGTDEVWVEDKRLSLVVHARRSPDPDAAIAAVSRDVRALADRLGLEAHAGRDVLELRLPGYDKGRALRSHLVGLDPSALLYVGDDLGDLPAFDVVRERRREGHRAWSAGVGEPALPEVADAVDLLLPTADDVVALLHDIAAAG